MKNGWPHLIASSALGAALRSSARSLRRWGWPSRGAASMYCAIVVGFLAGTRALLPWLSTMLPAPAIVLLRSHCTISGMPPFDAPPRRRGAASSELDAWLAARIVEHLRQSRA